MKFTCQKSELVSALRIIGKAVSSNPQSPILAGVYLEAIDENTIELRGTDHELGIVVNITADIEERGRVILSAKYFQDIVSSMSGETVTLFADEEKTIANVSSGTATFDILSMSGEFPSVRMNEGNVNFKIKSDVFARLVQKTAFACSKDDKRPIFTGCYTEINDDDIALAATNTHRLSVQKEKIEGAQGSHHYIIPSRPLMEIARIFSSEVAEDIAVACTDKRISFTQGKIHITLRLIEGAFPDYRRVIPASFNTKVKLKTSDFTRAVERVSLIARHDDYKIMRFDFVGDEVIISSDNPQIGRAQEKVAVEKEGDDIIISFNYSYVSDVLKTIDSDEFYISLNESLKPASVVEPDNDSFIYIITPVKTKT